MAPPRPGRRARGSKSGRPIMALLDLLGRRGALRVLWELRGPPLTFRALQAKAALSPSVLNTRLAELRDAGVVDHGGDGYGLTPSGRDLLAELAGIHRWADAWARRERAR